jgi:endonuclease YncB( thermonuclease family)
VRFAHKGSGFDHALSIFKADRSRKNTAPSAVFRSSNPAHCWRYHHLIALAVAQRNAAANDREGVGALKSVLVLLAGAVLAASSPEAATAQLLTGRAFVLDGDSLMVDGQRIHILDVDAPESSQLCFKTAATSEEDGWECGRQAATALADRIGRQPVTCDTTARGVHKGWLARCKVAGQDLAQWLAASGWAVPASQCKCEIVRDASARAKAASRGIWSSNFTMPWDWRKAH